MIELLEQIEATPETAYQDSPQSLMIPGHPVVESMESHFALDYDADSRLTLPSDLRAQEDGPQTDSSVVSKAANFLRNSRAGRAVTAFTIGLSLAGGYSLVHADTAKADSGTPVCTTSPGGDSTTCVYPPANQPPQSPTPAPNNPPKGGNNGGNGNNPGSGHNGGNNNDGKPHLLDYYENPLRNVRNLVPWRIDEGVDYHGHGPVYAIGTGVVTLATRSSSFWGNEGGNAVVYRLTEGPAKGLKVFVSEACTPRVHKRQRVTPDTVVCRMHGDSSFPGIETGWAMLHDRSRADYPAARPVYSEGDKTAYGVNFNRLMVKLGAPAGNSVYPHVSSTRYQVGSIPHRYRKLSKVPK